MSYILNNKNEVYRLQEQSEAQSYQLEQELGRPHITKGSKVLEIGCGAGSLINYLKKYYHITAYACDLQAAHIEYCKENIKGVEFSEHDILVAPYKHKVDHIFMRYITHHLGVKNFKKAILNIKESMNDSAMITIIDVDGLLANFGTINPELEYYIQRIRDKFSGDLFMGRKIPELLHQNGFKILETNLQTINFKGEARHIEINQWKKRFEFAKETYTQMLGSEMEYAKFKKLFFEEISREHIPYFLNKVITIAQLN